MIDSLLIANRGEIARRIIRTARRLGVRSIAVFSEADANAPHVREADDAALIGPAAVRESYLAAERILDAARRSGARAIHPGYGFLSENAEFAEAVLAADLIWVGPPPGAIRAMGLKDAAKALMVEAGVPVTPGYLGDDQTPERLQREADQIGYPVLIKAVSGGGGMGMRKVENPADFPAALASCQREAASSFGNDRVLIEAYINRPRHLEVQIFADQHGNVVHLFERDCSVQRRHQKVIEEAPAPGMTEQVRAAICGFAVNAARAVNYEGAGTVEFIADASEGLRADRVWFMEMNTRLQVEHPVTEMVTGLDLVEWQLRVASGQTLPLTQEQIRLKGHAIEARLYAENPSTGFLPSTGNLTRFRLPDPPVRVDTGVEEGGEVTPFYDPMIAKLICHAPTRATAARDLADACRKIEIWPVRTNAAFLARCLDHGDFIEGAIDTNFISARRDALVPSSQIPASALTGAATLWLAHAKTSSKNPSDPWEALTGFRAGVPTSIDVPLQAGDELHWVHLEPSTKPQPGIVEDGTVAVFVDGEAYSFTAPRFRKIDDVGSASGSIVSPMPGRVVKVFVTANERVSKGQLLVTVEAMKMEHTLAAPYDAVVAEVSVAADDQVSEGTSLIRLARVSS